MKLWVDDLREPPDQSWIWAQTYPEAIRDLSLFEGQIEVLSLDHDLGERNTGYDILTQIEVWLHGERPYAVPPAIRVHSANPVGRDRMKAAIAAIRKKQGR